MLFEGEYYNDNPWIGKGYDILGNLIYELKDGKGLVKKYDNDGKIKFEGEYKNGLINGKGKEYDFNGELIFEGEYLYGLKNGKGKEYYSNGNLKFEGEYLNRKKMEKGNIIIAMAN